MLRHVPREQRQGQDNQDGAGHAITQSARHTAVTPMTNKLTMPLGIWITEMPPASDVA